MLPDKLKNYAHALGMSESHMMESIQKMRNVIAQPNPFYDLDLSPFASKSGPPEEQKVLMAFLEKGTMIVWCKGKDVEMDIENVGPIETADYIVDTKEAPDHGLHVWEGHVKWVGGGSYDDDGPQPEYVTKCWREPTPDEWAKIIQQENPFELPPPEEEIRFGNRTTL